MRTLQEIEEEVDRIVSHSLYHETDLSLEEDCLYARHADNQFMLYLMWLRRWSLSTQFYSDDDFITAILKNPNCPLQVLRSLEKKGWYVFDHTNWVSEDGIINTNTEGDSSNTVISGIDYITSGGIPSNEFTPSLPESSSSLESIISYFLIR